MEVKKLKNNHNSNLSRQEKQSLKLFAKSLVGCFIDELRNLPSNENKGATNNE